MIALPTSRPPLAAPAQAILDRMLAANEPPVGSLSVAQVRETADQRVLGATFVRREGVLTQDRVLSEGGLAVPVRVYRPASRASERALPVLVYFHGGGMVVGSIETVDAHCRYLCLGIGCLVVSVGYRLAPEHRFPAAVEDCLAATLWLLSKAHEIGGDGARLVLMGESAGGTLAGAVAVLLQDGHHPRPSLLALIYPALEATAHGPWWDLLGEGYFLSRAKSQWYLDQYLRTPEDAQDARASPVLAERVDGFPPTLLITAGLDPLIGASLRMAERLWEAGVAVEHHTFADWPHGYFYWAHTDAAQRTMALCTAAVSRALGSQP